jgi:cytochrome c5
LANSGESTYQKVCASCHTPGVAGAPKLGDQAKWAALIKEGQVQITAHGYVGIRGMPAKGGKPDLSVSDFAASVVYMANQSGASWKNPDDAMLKKIDAEIQRRQTQLRK